MDSLKEPLLLSSNRLRNARLRFHKGGRGSKKNHCWSGYEAIGMKEKNGKLVPNCVKIGYGGNMKKKQSSRSKKYKPKNTRKSKYNKSKCIKKK